MKMVAANEAVAMPLLAPSPPVHPMHGKAAHTHNTQGSNTRKESQGSGCQLHVNRRNSHRNHCTHVPDPAAQRPCRTRSTRSSTQRWRDERDASLQRTGARPLWGDVHNGRKLRTSSVVRRRAASSPGGHVTSESESSPATKPTQA
eukprot:CAMPEP_0202870482 /NCGR_PEP_ID=MMETSP1391-20130828/15863_1 /ASSEMBLY_ACC=CAM_ASM_000867 /TAXON_ID=1034604 /ORGANISM="Chlamydomonas leiostraca, Strain SAG 11-49" /LENGTH=145 /DNA_ID=CAMNT_0049551063 /DNA_START=500 /DNA_END=934 /DNA_ORIENTATION=+